MAVGLLPGRVLLRSEHVWSTVVSVEVRDPWATDDALDAAWAEVREELHRVDRVYSPFRPDSEVSRLRRLELRLLEGDVAEVVDRCLAVRALTRGAFDPWAAPGGFDPCGLVKGWAADRCAAILCRHGFRSFMVDAGGDVVCRGTLPGDPTGGWPIGIAHPDDRTAVIEVVECLDAAVATSGTSERGEHVIDPRTGAPAVGARQATVVGPDAAVADALATALMVAGTEGATWFRLLPEWSAALVVGGRLTTWGPAFAA